MTSKFEILTDNMEEITLNNDLSQNEKDAQINKLLRAHYKDAGEYDEEDKCFGAWDE